MAEHQDSTYHSNPFRAMMNQLSYVLKANPISVLTLGLLMIATLIVGVIVISLIAGLFNNTFGGILAVILGIAYVLLVVFRFVAASYSLHFASREGRSLTAKQALDEGSKKNFNQFILTSVAGGALIFIGLIALVIPGIYLFGRLCLAPYIALHEGLGVMDSLKRSWKLSDGHWFEVFSASIVSAVTIPSGLLAFSGGQSGIVGRYVELIELDKSGAKKPETHWMNYLLTGVVLVFALFYAVIIRNARNAANTNTVCNDTDYSFLCEGPNAPNAPSDYNLDNFYNSSPAQ